MGYLSRATGQRWVALLAYAFSSVMLFGIPVLAHPGRAYIGSGNDPGQSIWDLKWWPYAISHGINPLYTHLLWAPSGLDLVGAPNSIPGPSLVAAPLTLLAGPVVTYNLIVLLAPALSAWTAYLLCRHITGRFWPALVGGYLFGFSTYELAKLSGHLFLALTFLIPVAVLLVLRRVEGSLSPRSFVLVLALVLFAQFLISLEVSLMLAIFGGLTLLLAIALMPSAARRRVARTLPLIALCYAVTVEAVLPYVYVFLFHPSTVSYIYPDWPQIYSTDPVSLFVPSSVTWLGRHNFAALSAGFSGNPSEWTAYLGLPLAAIVFLFAVTHWRRPVARVLLASFALITVASFGPVLHVAGTATMTLPWRYVLKLPLARYALPARFMVFAWLLVAVMVALWLASEASSDWTKWLLMPLAILFLLPSSGARYWKTELDTPAFFTSGAYERVLRPGENVLVIPYGWNGNSMVWQAQADMAFRMPEGYMTSAPPKAFANWPILATFYDGKLIPNQGGELRRFLHANDVTAIVVKDGTPGPWPKVFASLGVNPTAIGGVQFYRVPASVLRAPAG